MKEAINSAILLMFRKYDSFCLEINYKENQLNVESVFDLHAQAGMDFDPAKRQKTTFDSRLSAGAPSPLLYMVLSSKVSKAA